MKTFTASLVVLGLLWTPLAHAQGTAAPATAPAAASATPWTQASLQSATYVVLPGVLEGNANLLGADQQAGMVHAMQHDLQGAVTRKYPGAKFVTDARAPGVIVLRPVLTMPAALVPWEHFQARVELSQGGNTAVVKDNFGVWDVYQHQADAANYLFDKLIAKLP